MAACGPHLDFEMWETIKLDLPLFVLGNSEFCDFPGLKIQTWATQGYGHNSPAGQNAAAIVARFPYKRSGGNL
jgi:hypothetical protein